MMKKFATLYSAVAVMLTLSGNVLATPMPETESKPRHDGLVGPRESRSTEDETPRVLTGRVIRVNAQEGTIVIQTPIGVIALRGPRQDLAGVSVGDIVQVELVESDYPAASPRLDREDQQ